MVNERKGQASSGHELTMDGQAESSGTMTCVPCHAAFERDDHTVYSSVSFVLYKNDNKKIDSCRLLFFTTRHV
jgi:hypothetical protein